jgi:hypothetical protein
MDGRAEKYFDTAPQDDGPMDASWRELHSFHGAPLTLRAGTDKVTMTFDDLLDNDHKITTRHDDELRCMIARAKIANIMSE